jgi:phosphoserine phosphatase RsbU/P
VFNSIRTRLIAVLAVCAVVTLGAGITLDYQLSRDELLQRLQAEASDTVKAALTDLENLLDGVEGTARMLGRVVAGRNFSNDALARLARELVEGNPDIYGATIALNPQYPGNQAFAPYFYKRQGMLTRVDLQPSDAAYPQQDWFRQAAGGGQPVWVEPYFDRHGGKTLMTTYSVPVFHTDEHGVRALYAVVTADIALEELDSYLRRLQLGEQGNSILLSRQGKVLSSRDSSQTMRHYSELLRNPASADQWQALIANVLDGASRTAAVTCPSGEGDCKLLLAPLVTTGWPLAILYDEQELLAPLRVYGLKSAAIGLVTVLIMILAVMLVTRRITRPLEALALASGDIARGKMDSPLPRANGADEVSQLVGAFKTMQGDLQNYVSELENATARRSRLEGELAAAREIQMAMLPGAGELYQQGQHHHLWATVLPARAVGGDFYSYREENGVVSFAVGDVSDKGVPAALFMARAISLLQQFPVAADPADTLAKLNNSLTENNDNCMFVTLLLARLDLPTGTLCTASAGHPAPLLCRNGEVSELHQESGPASGLASGLSFPRNDYQLQNADRLAVYTDGIDEAFDGAGNMFSLARLTQSVQHSAHQPPRDAGLALLGAVKAFSKDTPQSDDITLLVLDFDGAGEQGVKATFRLDEKPVSACIEWLAQQLQPLSLPAELPMELALVAEEIIANIADHSGLPDEASVAVELVVQKEAIILQVCDPGLPFNPLSEGPKMSLGADTDSAEIGGLGTHLISQLSDEQHYRRDREQNILRVTRYLDAASDNE